MKSSSAGSNFECRARTFSESSGMVPGVLPVTSSERILFAAESTVVSAVGIKSLYAFSVLLRRSPTVTIFSCRDETSLRNLVASSWISAAFVATRFRLKR